MVGTKRFERFTSLPAKGAGSAWQGFLESPVTRRPSCQLGTRQAKPMHWLHYGRGHGLVLRSEKARCRYCNLPNGWPATRSAASVIERDSIAAPASSAAKPATCPSRRPGAGDPVPSVPHRPAGRRPSIAPRLHCGHETLRSVQISDVRGPMPVQSRTRLAHMLCLKAGQCCPLFMLLMRLHTCTGSAGHPLAAP
jgi:hypothetical protein